MKTLLSKTFLALLPLFVIHCAAFAQPAFQWGVRGGSMGTGSGAYAEERVLEMATDKNGNVYVLAVNNPGLANVEGHPGHTQRDKLTLASFTCNGTFRWMKNMGSASSTIGRAMGMDTLGGIYITGVSLSSNPLGYAYYDADTTLGPSNKRMFLVKYDTAGTFKWLKLPQPDSTSPYNEARTLDLIVSPGGDLFWHAWLTNANYENNAFVVTTPAYTVMRYNSSGVYQSKFVLGMTTTDGGSSANAGGITNAETARMQRDHNTGRFYMAGQYDKTYGTISFGSTAINSTGGIGALPIYLTAFDANGGVLWIKQSPASSYADTRNMRPVIDPQGNIFIGGSITPGNSFNGHTFTTSVSNSTTPFAVAVNPSGNNIWATNAEAVHGACAAMALTYSNNTIALAGYYAGTLKWGTDSVTAPLTMQGNIYVFLTRLNATTGAVIGMDSIKADNSPKNGATSLTSDKNGNFFVGGKFDYRLFPGNDTLQSIGGSQDWFVAKFGSPVCNCTVPVAAFSNTVGSSNAQIFTYTGSMPIDSVRWTFGDGTQATGSSAIHVYATTGNYTACAIAYNNCGSNSYCKTISTNGMAVGNLSSGEEINLYPNPVGSVLNVQGLPGGATLEIYNSIGQRVLPATAMKGRKNLVVEQLPSGVYLLRVEQTNGELFFRKFVKS